MNILFLQLILYTLICYRIVIFKIEIWKPKLTYLCTVKNKTLQIHIRLKTLSTETDTDFLLVKTDFLNSRDSFEFSPHLFTNQFLSYFTCSMFTMIFYVAY